MLKRIAVLNSRVYGKAEIRLDDCDSLQLVGPNNIGKSTLIYALNFLFIIDGNKMTFSGQRRGDKETIHHYFPTPNQSYLIFEICKQEHYCILVKRDSEGDLEYYRFDQPYHENIFFEDENKQQRLLRFEEVKERLSANGIQLNQFKNKAEVFGTVYQRGRNNEGAVWLEDNVKSDGLSNNFSKVYRYLINSKLINNKTLKEALVIADNRDNEGLNFSQKNKKDILDLLKINNEIRNIKAIRNEFFDFREIVNQYHAKAKVVNQLYYAFTNSYAETLPELDEHIRIRSSEISALRTEINEILYPRKQELDREIGAKGSDIRNQQIRLDEKESLYKQISKIEPAEFLKVQLENLEKERSEVEYQLNTVDKQKGASQQTEEKLKRIQSKIDRLEKQIRDYDNLLIHKISDNPEVKTLLNSVFSGQMLSLTKEDIKKQIKKPSKNLKIFDGEIDVSNIELREIENIEELQQQADELIKEKNELLKLLQVVREREQYQDKLNGINKQLQLVRKNIELAATLPKLEEEVKTLISGLDKLKNEKVLLEKELNALTGEIVKKSNSTSQLIEEKNKLETRMKELQGWKSELEMYSINGEEYQSSEGLETLYRKIKISHADRTELKSRKDRLFDKLREKLASIIADETSFIRYVEEEIACINDKEKSIDGLLQSISTQFANPAHTLLRRFEEFKYFVYNRFNNKLSRTRISDIESLKIELIENKKLMEEIRKISAIQELKDQLMLDFDQSDSLRVLNQYLDSSRKVSFDELFDIELHLTLKGTTKKVDLSNQVESDGTDRMIRLVIIMSIINRLAINDEENRIALFIDEVATIDKHNRPELVNFCREHNFIPIFAAPDPVPGFSKYYYITPNPNQKLIVNERHALHARSKEPLRRIRTDEEGFFAESALQIEVN